MQSISVFEMFHISIFTVPIKSLLPPLKRAVGLSPISIHVRFSSRFALDDLLNDAWLYVVFSTIELCDIVKCGG